MRMFDLNPLNLPAAQLQHGVMLLVSGALGFMIGYVSRQRTLRQLEGDLNRTERAVDDCRQASVIGTAPIDTETITLNRIRTRANEINFGRIGIASVTEADDLKVIVGIGPFLEKKLHALGIYTFRQIANFNQDDIEQVNDLIEFFPGRIERDNWVGQAKELVNRK